MKFTRIQILFLVLCFAGFSVQVFAFELSNTSEARSDIVLHVNEQRVASGLSALRVSKVLTLAAQQKADDMAGMGYFSHTSPNGVLPWKWFQKNSVTGYATSSP